MTKLIFEPSFYPLTVTLDVDRIYTTDELNEIVRNHCFRHFGTTFDCYFLDNGRGYNEANYSGGDIHVIPRIRGGKGGFGSMLRAIGAQIEKTTNREACRDLSGRRLRDINEEKRLKKWIAEQAEREQEAARRKKKKLEKLTEIVKHDFVDEDYTKSRLEMPEKIHESVEEGLKVAAVAKTTERENNDLNGEENHDKPSCSSKRTKEDTRTKVKEEGQNPKATDKKKKIKGNLWVDDLEGLDDSESSEEETPKKRTKTS